MKNKLLFRSFAVVALVFAGVLSLSLVASKPEIKVKVPTKTTWVNAELEKMTLEQKIGQFFMVAAYSNRGEEHYAHLDSLITEQHIGGMIFFQGQRLNMKNVIDRFQAKSDVPLLIGLDAEWGVQMRLFGEDRFPYNYTIGAANDPKLTKTISEMIAQECRDIGVHINFAPVADVNSNPNNPVIGFRSYGENPISVASHVKAAVQGMEQQGVLTSIKHFPGHGDTGKDSHYALPVVENSYTQIDAIDFPPFRAGIRAGTASVMIAHLSVPALDSSGTPSSLSPIIIKEYLQGQLGFKGLVISDALNMKAVADRYGKTEVVVKAFQAGCDILLFPESVEDAIQAIKMKVEAEEISMEEIDARCRKVLNAKYKAIINPKKVKNYDEFEIELAKKQVYEKAITVLKNENEALPIKRFDQRIAHVSIGTNTRNLKESINLAAPLDHFHFYTVEEAERRLGDTLNSYDMIITALHSNTVRSRNDYGLPKGWQQWINNLPEKKNVLAFFGNPLGLKNANLSKMDAVVLGYENHALAQDRMGQFLMGTYASSGKLPITMNDAYRRNHGVEVAWSGRLKESQPEELGISRVKLLEIDRIVQKGLDAGAFPGCQVVVAVKGKVIWRKSYGYHTYDKKRKVKNTDLYDIASITKIAASTSSLMILDSEGKFDLSSKLGEYLPDLTEGTGYSNIGLRSMLAHQSGLVAWIPFYKRTLDGSQPSKQWYAPMKSSLMDVPVANDLWIQKAYTDTIYQRILRTPLKTKRYKYSDLGYYFIKKIVEKQSGEKMEDFTRTRIYEPMGLRYMRYKPMDYFPLSKITPTEDDKIFRKQLVHGHVHDPGAAMIGGVGGHAGLFSNAGDMASLMQMFLNKGSYGGTQYIQPEVIGEYTKRQYSKNRRGAGFDKPTTNGKGGPSHNGASGSSFGHSGFTGTLAWADPVNEINYVFLSNRVYPDAENWLLVKMSTRTEIQRVIYEAVQQANL
ncbi:MAG: glycoside hydrolase family 3 N-terminal domain-containing protein [Crocinitomicaceae bacterium]|nr:glycoside hydrolase family 3 N-terminal domain-containing protein [Crocinitomicaceae bacterium]